MAPKRRAASALAPATPTKARGGSQGRRIGRADADEGAAAGRGRRGRRRPGRVRARVRAGLGRPGPRALRGRRRRAIGEIAAKCGFPDYLAKDVADDSACAALCRIIACGLSRAKAKAVVGVARAFLAGDLSDELLAAAPSASSGALRALNGVGPWSCDMYLIFHLKKADVLPLGDLGVRAARRGPSALAAYYMWRVVDTKAFNQDADA
ncbi:hypothetical protein SO694_000970108 [Aureococcus anophagefferens]|uniref:HhH-GPD domain-containing protein n=1 Tax=Aureococcus anophagefferens TaxID=44056 RepID=A0ABR1FS54_AURAN